MFLSLAVIILGIISSVITAIIVAIAFVAFTSILKLNPKSEVRFIISACFSIGMGAALTPIREPLSTIATSKLNEESFSLLRLIGPAVIPGIIIFVALSTVQITPTKHSNVLSSSLETES